MGQNKIFEEKNVSKAAYYVFKHLYTKDSFESLAKYFSKSKPRSENNNEEELIKLSDGNRSLTGLFLKGGLESVKDRNTRAHQIRWFDNPFIFHNEQIFLSTQWNAKGDYQLTVDDLNYFLKICYNGKYELKNDGQQFVFLEFDDLNIAVKAETDDDDGCKQKIFFGAPGTGKSHKVNELVGEPKSFLVANDREARFGQFSQCGCAKANHYADVLSKQETFNQDVFAINNLEELKSLLESCDGDDKVKNPRHSALRAYIDFVSQPTVFRTTFHPDYDYAQFVGSYKPKKDKEDPKRIIYDFVPQVFAKAYKRAKETSEPVYLVIEEINRGNCAQIFGDIFQLLDRNESGESQYEIDVDSDFAEWLGESKIKLPPNFNILATMNTSDQSLFPMDSAFKRRFDWEYVPISFEGKSAANFQIEIGSSENVKYYSWQTFVEKVNAKILDLTESEDKQLGEYFIQPDKKLNDSDTEKTVISEERFKGKVMFYLWNEICKDEHKNGSFFKIENDFFTFQDLYKDDSKLAAFMEEIEKTGKN